MARITRYESGIPSNADDVLAVEEPLEIRVGERPVSVTLRTPGEDFDLAAGFLFTESILRSSDEIASIRHWGSPNVVRVDVRENVKLDLKRLQRHFYSTSSCGVCGKASIDALRVNVAPIESSTTIPPQVITSLPDKLRAAQKAFDATGAIHAAGIFTPDGELLRVREDVGRHNAVDKVLGSYFREGQSLADHVMVVSGRTSFEIVQKALVARIGVLAAVGAPSTLAVHLADEFHLTLLGFVREGRFNVYSVAERVND
jgi:FdhD protein